MQVKLHDITPELVRELSEELEQNELRSLIRAEVRQLSDDYKVALDYASQLLARCQIRAIKLHNLGVEIDEIAEMFDESKRVVTKWISSDISVSTSWGRNEGGEDNAQL